MNRGRAPSKFWRARLRPGRLGDALLVLLLGLVPAFAQRGPAPVLLPPDQQLRHFHLPPGFEIQLVASDPEIQKPLNLNFDAAGRVWVTGTEIYPWPARRDARGEPVTDFDRNWGDIALQFRVGTQPPAPPERGRDTIRVLSDFGPDGRARRISVFADNLNIPAGIQPLPRRPGSAGDAVIAYSIPAIWRFEDTDGDGRADVREMLYSGFGFKDTHGMSSNYVLWPDGWIYGTHGFANRSEIRDRAGNVVILDSGNTYRFRPDGSRFEPWVHGQTNPFGLSFDPYGDLYSADSHSKPVYLLQRGGYYEGIFKTHDGLGFAPAMTQDNHGSTAIAGIAYYAATQFPEEFRGNLFNGNPITRRINRVRLNWQGSTPQAERMPDFLTCDDPSFRPVQVKLGPDGALWIADFYNPIIGHYEAPLTDPNRDRSHGRIWRIVWRGLNLEVPVPNLPGFATDGAARLGERLSDTNLVVRTLAAHELAGRVGRDAVPALRGLAERTYSAARGPASLPLAWLLERLAGPIDEPMFATLLKADDEAGVAALRILGERPGLAPYGEPFFADLVARTAPGRLWRQVADVFARHPQSWQVPLLLRMRAQCPPADLQLAYALRLSLKTQVARATPAEFESWTRLGAQAEAHLAEVCVAVPTRATGEFLLGYLQRNRFQVPAAGEYARHAVMQIPAERLDLLESVVRELGPAPIAQQMALAEGVAEAVRKASFKLPETVDAWLRATLLTGMKNPDASVALRAVRASRSVALPEKHALIREFAVKPDVPGEARIAAVESIPADAQGIPILGDLLINNRNANVRKAAVRQLATALGANAARAAFLTALPDAPSDLAFLMAVELAKSDLGAAALVAEVQRGKLPATILQHYHVASALGARPSQTRDQVAALVKNLPTEEARLSALVEQRTKSFAQAKPNLERGAAIFTQYCAACHRSGSEGGNIGPSLDGIGARGVARVAEDILDPNRNVDPAFRLTTITAPSGESLTGMNFRESGDSVILKDPATGQDNTRPRSAVAKIDHLTSSAMPAGFESALPEADFYDLLGYLLRPAEGK